METRFCLFSAGTLKNSRHQCFKALFQDSQFCEQRPYPELEIHML